MIRKRSIYGVISNSSTNPFQTFSNKAMRKNSRVFSFDISFDLCDDEGGVTHVWFNRSFRFPPPMEDGDTVEVRGRHGLLLGLVGRKNFYAARVIDRSRRKEYTTWRNKDMAGSPGKKRKGNLAVPGNTQG